jgi:hypothetical protein
MSGDLPADVPKTDRELLLQISYDVNKMKTDVVSKCDQINRHEDRLSRLEKHDYAELAIAGIFVLVMGWAIAA